MCVWGWGAVEVGSYVLLFRLLLLIMIVSVSLSVCCSLSSLGRLVSGRAISGRFVRDVCIRSGLSLSVAGSNSSAGLGSLRFRTPGLVYCCSSRTYKKYVAFTARGVGRFFPSAGPGVLFMASNFGRGVGFGRGGLLGLKVHGVKLSLRSTVFIYCFVLGGKRMRRLFVPRGACSRCASLCLGRVRGQCFDSTL